MFDVLVIGGGNAANRIQPGDQAEGCPTADDAPMLWRQRFHHATFYGFMLCFAATSVATLYHYVFKWAAPCSTTSVPVLLGTVGGIGLLADD